jgi:hypothetical protein
MNLRLSAVAVFLLLASATKAQTTEVKMDSGLASARIVAARKTIPLSAQQCLANLSVWKSNDAADEKLKVEAPAWWYQKLSTEELVRLSSQSLACGSTLQRDHQQDQSLMRNYCLAFTTQLLFRAENVLTDNYLMNAYLLRPSR